MLDIYRSTEFFGKMEARWMRSRISNWEWEDDEVRIRGNLLLIGKLLMARNLNREAFEELISRA